MNFFDLKHTKLTFPLPGQRHAPLGQSYRVPPRRVLAWALATVAAGFLVFGLLWAITLAVFGFGASSL